MLSYPQWAVTLTACREFVANKYWPSKGVEGAKLNDMYLKIKVSEDKAKATGEEPDKGKTSEQQVKAEEKAEVKSDQQDKAKITSEMPEKAQTTSEKTNGEASSKATE